MPIDDQLAILHKEIQTYRDNLPLKKFFNDQSQLRKQQANLLLDIINDAQQELQDGYRPHDTSAQIDDIINSCRQTTIIGKSLLGSNMATRVKTRILLQYGLPRRNIPLAKQSQEWNTPKSVINILITDPNTRRIASKIDVQVATQVANINDMDEDIARITLTDDKGISACHDIAGGLQRMLGHTNGYFETKGGAGRENRSLAIELAINVLNGSKACVIWLKCTATCDGHSFTLVKKPSGIVDVLESWANPGGNGYLLPLKEQLKYNITNADAITAVTRLNDLNEEIRDKGYGVLSTAYGNAENRPAHHFEERNQ